MNGLLRKLCDDPTFGHLLFAGIPSIVQIAGENAIDFRRIEIAGRQGVHHKKQKSLQLVEISTLGCRQRSHRLGDHCTDGGKAEESSLDY